MRNITNSNCDSNVYINTNMSAILPLEENQSSFNNPIVVSMKGLNGFSGAGKIIKINSTNDALEYDDETVYTATNPLNITGSVVSLSGLNDFGLNGQVLKSNGPSNTVGWYDETDTTYSFTNPIINTSGVISLIGLTSFSVADAHKAIIVNGSGTALEYAPQQDTTYNFQSPLNNFFGSNNIILDTIPILKGGTNIITYSLGDILYCSASNVLSKLTIGSANQVLSVNSGVPSWETPTVVDLSTSTNFGTAVLGANTISLGNTTTTNQTVELELYFSSTLKLNNTGGGHIATFTNSLGGMDIDLKGGTITTSTMGSNTLWNGLKIEPAYGGTGLSSLTANKILQVNSAGTGFNQVSLPVGAIYSGTGLIAVNSSTNVISFTGTIPTNNNTLTNGAGYITSAQVPASEWSVNPTDNLHPTSSSRRLVIGNNASFNTTTFLNVFGDMYFQSRIVDFDEFAGVAIYMSCNRGSYNEIVMGIANSDNQASNYGAKISNRNTSNTVNRWAIDTVSPSGNQPRFSINSDSGDTKVLIESYLGDAELQIGDLSSYYKIEATQGGTTFKIMNYNNTPVFQYTRSNGYITWGSINGSRMNLGIYLLHGTNTAYPSNSPFGSINSIYTEYVYAKNTFTDNIIVSQYGANGTGTSNNIRCNSSAQMYLTNPVFNGNYRFQNSNGFQSYNTMRSENVVVDSTSIPYSANTQIGGLSRQGDHAHSLFTKCWRFSSSQTMTLYQGASIRVFWDGVSKQIKFDILQSRWWDAGIDHIKGGTTQNPPRNTFTNDIASAGSGLWLTGGSAIGAFSMYSYGTFVRASLVSEGLSTGVPAFWFDYTSGSSASLYLIMKFISNTNNA